MSELEKIGISGPDYLRETLTNCSDPLKAIEEFQDQNSVLLPSLKPALHFLDLHSLHRSEFHSSVVEVLRDALLKQVTELRSAPEDEIKMEKLKELLDKSIVVVKNKTLRPVAMHIMKYVPDINIDYLLMLEKDPELYKETPVEAKRQIWQRNQQLFSEEVLPLLHSYIQHKESQLVDFKSHRSFYEISPKVRRSGKIITQLVDMIGHNIELYDMMLQFLRSMFMRSKNLHYCTLRCDILMSLHENEVNDICSMDPSHKFAWCLDACIRENLVDSKRAKELQTFLDSIKKGQDEVLGDLAMVLADPYSLHTCCVTILKIIHQSALNEKLPRESNDLILLLRMINLGLSAANMMDTSVFKERKINASLVTKYLTDIQLLMMDEYIRTMNTRLTNTTVERERADDISISLVNYIIESDIAALISSFYALQVLDGKEPLLFSSILEALQTEGDIAYTDTILHHIVNKISHNIEQLLNAGNLIYIIDTFFMVKMNRDYMIKHILRLFLLIHKKIPKNILNELLTRISVDQQDATLKAIYEQLDQYADSGELQLQTQSLTDENTLDPNSFPTT